MMESLFWLSGFFGALCSGCALWGMLRGDSPFVFALGCFYGVMALAYFIVAAVAVAFA